MNTLLEMDPVWIVLPLVWTLVWKGFALWRAARREEKGWYIALLVINTLGLLEIVYYFLIAKTDSKQTFKKRS